MKLPKTTEELIPWVRDRVEECFVSVESRRRVYREYRDIFYTGSGAGEQASKHNKVFSHIDKLSSYLFSPAEVRYTLDFQDSDSPLWKRKAEVAGKHLNRLFSRRRVDIALAEANMWSLVKGCTVMRVNWSHGGFEPWVIQPEFFGVMNEAEPTLDRQEAFCVTTMLTESALERLLTNHPRRREIMSRIGQAFDASMLAEMQSGGGFSVFGGGSWPNGGIGIPGISTPAVTQQGMADVLGAQMGPILAPEVQARLIELHELWVWDDDRDDWTTIQYAEPGLIFEGRYQRRNLTGVKGEHPFVRVCSNEVPNYFWGRSEIAGVAVLQKMLNARIENVDAIYRMQANPSRIFRGFSGLTADKAKALLSPGSILTDSNPASTTSVDTTAPQIPQGYLEYIREIVNWFDEAGGFTAILSGQGEPGVRAGTHANTLLRTSTPRLRDRALLLEKQVAEVGDLCFHLLAAKDATTFDVPSHQAAKGGLMGAIVRMLAPDRPDDESFLLSQLPKDVSVVVDSHTSSPAFSGEAEQKAFALFKDGAIGVEDLIRLSHPPMEDELIAAYRDREAGKERMLAELKEVDPEAWAKAVSGAPRRR